jgi:uncharacterized membrane protein
MGMFALIPTDLLADASSALIQCTGVTTMPMGPIELVIVHFPDEELHVEIVPAIRQMVAAGTVRIADLVFILKNSDGEIRAVELADAGSDVAGALDGVIDAFDGLLSVEDFEELGAPLENGTSALVVLFENTWAAPFVDAARKANGEVIFNERIPRSVIEELLSENDV